FDIGGRSRKERNVHTLLREPPRDRLADALARAGDERGAPLESQFHVDPLCSESRHWRTRRTGRGRDERRRVVLRFLGPQYSPAGPAPWPILARQHRYRLRIWIMARRPMRKTARKAFSPGDYEAELVRLCKGNHREAERLIAEE